MRRKGKITDWNDDRGFGFIAPVEKGERVFVHISAFNERGRRPAVNDPVTYSIGAGDGGKLRAVRVAYENRGKGASRRGAGLLLPGVVVAVFFAALSMAVSRGASPAWLLHLYAVASVLAFFTYGLDKYRAKQGLWRIQESTLHLMELLGGWPGALIGQRLFRHKSSKSSYQTVFRLCVAINIAALIWLHTDHGGQFLRSLAESL